MSLLIWNGWAILFRLDYSGTQGQFKVISKSNYTKTFLFVYDILPKRLTSHISIYTGIVPFQLSTPTRNRSLYMLEYVIDIYLVKKRGGGVVTSCELSKVISGRSLSWVQKKLFILNYNVIGYYYEGRYGLEMRFT